MNSAWMDDAICTPDAAWTADYEPDVATLDRLGAICAACPVTAACATYALDYRCETGMYAGVWLPSAGKYTWASRKGNQNWVRARRALRHKALVS